MRSVYVMLDTADWRRWSDLCLMEHHISALNTYNSSSGLQSIGIQPYTWRKIKLNSKPTRRIVLQSVIGCLGVHKGSLSWQRRDCLEHQSPASHTIYRSWYLPSSSVNFTIYCPLLSPWLEGTSSSNIKTQIHKHQIKNHSSDSTQTSMRYNYFVPLILLIGTVVSDPIPLVTRTDGHCNHANGRYHNPDCPRGTCCSDWDWCGNGVPWCGGPVPPGPSPPDGSCDRANGGIYGNPSCPGGSCCSLWGWCGYGSPWCP